MVKELYEKHVFIYIMLGLCGCGILIKVILDILYRHLIKASDNMGTSKNKLTQMMKKKFETCFKLKIGVNNVDIFVDKYVYRYRFGGILLSTWESICGQLLMLCLLTGSIGSIVGLIYECGKQEILKTFSVGVLTGGLLILLEGILNTSAKKELIRLNMKDYLENFFKVRLEQEFLNPELIEQYKKELLTQEGQVLTESAVQGMSRSALKIERRNTMKLEKEKARLEKERNRIVQKAAREKAIEEKKLARAKKKEEKEQKRKEVREMQERIQLEAKLALEKKREAERAEEERRKEEKRRQEEIKRALLVEKQSQKEEKNKRTTDRKTIAQERKESLKKEIQERRSLGGNESVITKEENQAKNENLVESESVYDAVKEAVVKEAVVKEVPKTEVPKAETPKTEVPKTITKRTGKRGKPVDATEEKLIEDILKEFLA